MMNQPHEPATASPAWSANTKLIVGLTMVFVVGALLVKFQFILTPLFISLLLAYLLHPLAEALRARFPRAGWGCSVSIVYALLLALLLGLLAWGGFSLVQQGQGVLEVVRKGVESLPKWVAEYSNKKYDLIFTQIDFNAIDLTWLSEQALALVNPLINQTGSLLASLAGGAANFLGWTLFVLFVSYFIVAESGGARGKILEVDLPGYSADAARLMSELSRIWNAFLRGQIILFLITVIIYILVLELLGVNYAITLAFIAGLARFLPYVGPAVNWVVLILIAYFQAQHPFGLSPFWYAALVLAITVLLDMVIDYMVTPRIYSDTLQVHPAAVLVAAIVAATLFGVLGVVVAAPILASALLLWKYVMAKMLDRDPWQEIQPPPPPVSLSQSLRESYENLKRRLPRRK